METPTQAYNITTPLQQLLSASQAYHYRVVPVAHKEGVVQLLTDTENTLSKSAELEIILGKEVTLELISFEVFNKLLSRHYRLNGQNELNYTPDFLEKILWAAKQIGSSDIHFEPYTEFCRVRLRLDGKLIEQYQIPVSDYPTILNKIKIRAGLDIAEKRLPQDGRISVKDKNNEFDIRVSCLPTLHGEKVVLRILSKDAAFIQIDSLGMTNTEKRTFISKVKKPQGIVLISGPTGSGKTTTLYAALKLLNDQKTNILTIEDPIEYTLEGVNQVQLKENIGLNFTAALKTFLRQDPDIIMVGEIRDVETAKMAIRASLTGHLVLSTIHTNSAWATISRLVDMGIPPFLIATTLTLSVAQRLVRKLCVHCKKEVEYNAGLYPEIVEVSHLKTHWVSVGCENCHQTGYSGRKAIYELLPITTELLPYIKNNETRIDDYLQINQIQTLKNNGLRLVREGITSLDEVHAIIAN